MSERVLAFVLLALVAAIYGVSSESDTYFLALILPTAFGIPLSEAAYTVLLPLFGRQAVPSRRLLARAVLATGAVTAAISLAYVAGVLLLVEREVSLWLLFTPIIVAMPVAGVYAAFFTAGRQYALASMRVPMASAVAVVIVAVLLLVSRSPLLFAVAIAGGQLAVLALLAVRSRHIGVSEAGAGDRLHLPALLGSAGAVLFAGLVAGLGVVPVERFLAIGLPEGSVALLAFARAIALLPVLLPQALGNGIFPAAAQRHLALDRAALARLGLLALRLGLLAAMVGTALVVVCRRELVELALRRGEFGSEDIPRTAELVALLAPSLIGFGAASVANKALFAMQRQRLVAWISAAGVAAYVASALVLREIWGAQGLAAAFSISALVAGGLLAAFLGTAVGISARTALRHWVVAPVLLSAAFAAGAYGGWALVEGDDGFGRALAVVLVSTAVGTATLGAAAWLARGTERAMLSALISRRSLQAVRERAL